MHPSLICNEVVNMLSKTAPSPPSLVVIYLDASFTISKAFFGAIE